MSGVQCEFDSQSISCFIRRLELILIICSCSKKLWLTIVPVRRPSEQHGLGPSRRRCELQLFFSGIWQAVRCLKAHNLGHLNMQFQKDCPKDKNLRLFSFFGGKLGKISLEWALWCGSREIDNFSLSQLYMPYVNGKLSISWVEICIFQKDRT